MSDENPEVTEEAAAEKVAAEEVAEKVAVAEESAPTEVVKEAAEKVAVKDATKPDAKAAESSAKATEPVEPTESTKPKPKTRRRKDSKNVSHAVVHIKSTFNNTIVTFTDLHGKVISWSSSGQVGFKGSRKSTPSAAQLAAEQACNKAKEHGVVKVDVRVKGPGSGRETAVRTLQSMGIEVVGITDVTPLPHNGCRPPKRRRV